MKNNTFKSFKISKDTKKCKKLKYLNESLSFSIIFSQLFRHGDRTPTETYPKDPYINYMWPGGWGALTKVCAQYRCTKYTLRI